MRFGLLVASALIVVGVVACDAAKSNTPGTGQGDKEGTCAPSCPKACSGDNDCDTARGQLCCDYGSYGKSCADAKDCPELCSSDQNCDTQSGQACVRETLASEQYTCLNPKQGLNLCTTDANCDTTAGEVCCGIYAEPVCLPAARCPRACTKGGDCDTQSGEVCCTTLPILDGTLSAAGLCVDPQVMPCPNGCTKSSDCDTKEGELCCNDVCSKSCPRSCKVSADCVQELCCVTPSVNAPWVAGVLKPGYIVTTAPVCGDGRCGRGETTANCEIDCPAAGPVCGDGTCEGTENSGNCAQDCPPVQNCDSITAPAFGSISTDCINCARSSCCTELRACDADSACRGCLDNAANCLPTAAQFQNLANCANSLCRSQCGG